MSDIEVGQKWFRNEYEISNSGRFPMRVGEAVTITGCPPRRKWVSFRREKTGASNYGYHPDVFCRYYSPVNHLDGEFPKDHVLYSGGKYLLTFNGHQIAADTLAEVEALWISAKASKP